MSSEYMPIGMNPNEGRVPQNPAEAPIVSIEITDQDRAFLEQHIGAQSNRHGEYYVRTMHEGQPSEREVWYLAYYCLGKGKDEAVKALQEDYELSTEEARAAWIFSSRYPRTVAELLGRHNDSEGYMARVRQTADPHEELSLKP